MKQVYVVSFLVFALLQLLSSAYAEPELSQARASAQLVKMDIISETLTLNKKQEEIFWPLYNNYQEDLRKLGDKRIKLISDFTTASQNLSDEQASGFIRRALELEEQRLGLKRRYVGVFLGKLPPRIVARYFQIEQKIQAELDAKIAEQVPLAKQ